MGQQDLELGFRRRKWESGKCGSRAMRIVSAPVLPVRMFNLRNDGPLRTPGEKERKRTEGAGKTAKGRGRRPFRYQTTHSVQQQRIACLWQIRSKGIACKVR